MTVFGHYRLDGLLGAGGMGEVHRAWDTEQERVVALKVLPAALSRDDEYRGRFRREARLAARLNDPHVVPIHRHGEIDGQLYLEMRLIDGDDLGTVLDGSGPLGPVETAQLVTDVASALDAAHEAGLVHRDVKPSNVFLTRARPGTLRFAYLGDFGIARAMIPSSDSVRTASGTTMGTIAYMAPERFLGREVDGRVDVYALTCVLHECLTGQAPFPGDELPTVMHHHLEADPPRPSAHDPALRAFDAVVARGMAKDPADRFATAGKLAVAARAAAGGTAAFGVPADPPGVAHAPTGTAAPSGPVSDGGARVPGPGTPVAPAQGPAVPIPAPGPAVPIVGVPGPGRLVPALPGSGMPGRGLPGQGIPGRSMPGRGMPGTGGGRPAVGPWTPARAGPWTPVPAGPRPMPFPAPRAPRPSSMEVRPPTGPVLATSDDGRSPDITGLVAVGLGVLLWLTAWFGTGRHSGTAAFAVPVVAVAAGLVLGAVRWGMARAGPSGVEAATTALAATFLTAVLMAARLDGPPTVYLVLMAVPAALVVTGVAVSVPAARTTRGPDVGDGLVAAAFGIAGVVWAWWTAGATSGGLLRGGLVLLVVAVAATVAAVRATTLPGRRTVGAGITFVAVQTTLGTAWLWHGDPGPSNIVLNALLVLALAVHLVVLAVAVVRRARRSGA